MTIDEKVIEFKGKRIDLTKIKNPRLKKVFRTRVHNGEKFLFWYNDHTDRSRRYEEHSDHSDYGNDHHDHNDKHKDNHYDWMEREYGEYPSHHDKGHSDHTDRR